jgi:NitT/TauT family transport system substrate-binding protein
VRRSGSRVVLIYGWVLTTLACTGLPATPATPTASARPAAVNTAPAAAAAPTAVPTIVPPITVRSARTQGLGNILHIAEVRGYFKEQGIVLRLEEFRSAAEALPALSTGDLDMASSPPLPSLFNALARGIPLALALDGSYLAPGARGYPMIARLDEGRPVVQDLVDLRGKRVAHPARGNPAEPALERMLAEAGLSETALRDVEYMGFPEILAAFAGGSMDVAIVPEPWGAIAEDRALAARVRDASEYIPGAEIAMILFSERFARDRTDAARRFAVAYLRAARDYADAWENGRDRDAILAILAESANIDPRILDKAGYLAVRRNGRIDDDALAGWLDWLSAHGYVPEKPDLASVVDHQFADYAVQVLDGTR